MDPNLASAHWRKGSLLWDEEKWNASFAVAGEAVKLDPKKGEWLSERGYRYAQRGMADEAIADFETALRLPPEPESRLKMLRYHGWALINLDHPAGASEQFREAATLSTDPGNDADLQAGLAASAWLAGKNDESIAAFVGLHALGTALRGSVLHQSS